MDFILFFQIKFEQTTSTNCNDTMFLLHLSLHCNREEKHNSCQTVIQTEAEGFSLCFNLNNCRGIDLSCLFDD